MINFLSIFRAQIPDIIKRLDGVKAELRITKNNIQHLMSIEKELSEEVMPRRLVETAIDNFHVAIWIKDLDGRFLFANKACCKTILRCSLEEALNLKNGDLKRDALAQVCMKTDLAIRKYKVTKRWIEFALYEDGQKIFVDTIKSPIFDDDNKFIGVVGNAVNITKSIPDVIRSQDRKSNSIEIPINTTLNHRMFADLLERRSQPRD